MGFKEGSDRTQREFQCPDHFSSSMGECRAIVKMERLAQKLLQLSGWAVMNGSRGERKERVNMQDAVKDLQLGRAGVGGGRKTIRRSLKILLRSWLEDAVIY